MDLLGRASQIGLRKGLAGGSRGWLWLGVATTAVRAVRRFTARKAAVARLDLAPGESIEVRHYRRGEEPDSWA